MQRHPSRPSARPPARPRTVAGFRLPFFGLPCIHETPSRHRSSPVSGFLRPSATVAAWHPGPAGPVRGKASIPPIFVFTGSGAAICRAPPGFASVRVHPCPGNGPARMFLPIPRRQPARLRSSLIRITPRCSLPHLTATRSRHRA